MADITRLFTASLALAAALTLSCSGDGGDGDGSSSSGDALLLNFTSNYVNGALRWTDTDSLSLDASSLPFDQDSKVFAYDGKIFVLERPFNNSTFTSDGTLNCLTPPLSGSSSRTTVDLADGSNPYDIAFTGTTGYIAQYGLDYLLVFNTNSCTVFDSIPLPSVVAGSSASANAASIKVKDNALFVVMQIWDPYPSTALQGALVRIDATTKQQIGTTIPLIYYNPQSSVLSGDTLYIASAYDLYNSINLSQSGIEYVNLAASSASSQNLINGSALGGGATSMVLGRNVLWTIVYAAWGSATVKSVPIPGGGTPSSPVPGITKATCLAYDNVANKLFIGNGTISDTTSTFAPSLKAYYVTIPTPPPPTNPLDVGNSVYPSALPPYSLAIVRW
jgi:hypothetical protein